MLASSAGWLNNNKLTSSNFELLIQKDIQFVATTTRTTETEKYQIQHCNNNKNQIICIERRDKKKKQKLYEYSHV